MKILDNYHLGITLFPNLFVISFFTDIILKLPGPIAKKAGAVETQDAARPVLEGKVMTETIKSGDTIAVDYTGKHEDGKIFDSSEGKAPLTFTVGTGMLIKGFDTAVIGMKKGESKTITIPPEEGYGLRNEEAFVEVPRMHFPDEIPLVEGLQLELQDPNGRPVPGVVAEIGEESVKMDINHFLAGQTLIFDITISDTGLTPPAPPEHSCGCDSHGEGCGPDSKGNCGSDAKGNCGCGC